MTLRNVEEKFRDALLWGGPYLQRESTLGLDIKGVRCVPANRLVDPTPAVFYANGGMQSTSSLDVIPICDAFLLSPTGWLTDVNRPPTSTAAPRPSVSPPATAATELRDITKLNVEKLADVLSITKPTLYKWFKSNPTRDDQFEHLTSVLANVKEAARRLHFLDLKDWLRTPLGAAEPTPLDYLQQKRFRLFQGAIVQRASEQLGADIIPLVKRSKEEKWLVRERISPTPRLPEDESEE